MALDHSTEADGQNPARVLNRVSRLISRYFDRKLAGLGVNVAYLAVLGPLWTRPMRSQKELALSAGSSQAAMAELLARMVKERFLDRVQDENDKRQYLFSLAEKGVSIMPDVMTAIREGNKEVFAEFGRDELTLLLGSLGKLEQTLAVYE